jgi:hypothetical protein
MTPMLKHQVDNPHCSASGDEMELTVYIPPFGRPSAKVYSVFARIANAVRTRAPQAN